MAQVVISYEDKRRADCRYYPRTTDEALARLKSLWRRHVHATVTRDGQRIGGVIYDEYQTPGHWNYWLDTDAFAGVEA